MQLHITTHVFVLFVLVFLSLFFVQLFLSRHVPLYLLYSLSTWWNLPTRCRARWYLSFVTQWISAAGCLISLLSAVKGS